MGKETSFAKSCESGAESITNRKKWIRQAFRCVVVVLVTLGIAAFVRDAWDDLAEQEFSLSQLSLSWFLLAVLLYTVGMVPFWLFWHRVLNALGERPTFSESSRAYFIGHLGKYVPGKAMVVVLRAGLVKSERTHPAVAATAVFVETLTMMAVGAFVAAACLMPQVRDHPGLIGLAILLMLLAGIPTAPPVFRKLVAILQVRRAHPEIEERLAGLTWTLMGAGWLMHTVGWLLYGLSMYAVLQAFPGIMPTWTDLPRLTGSVALAIVAGFLSLIPAGLGVRELILLPLLGPFGAAKAIICVILSRLSWLVSELMMSIILYLPRKRQIRESIRAANETQSETNSQPSNSVSPTDT